MGTSSCTMLYTSWGLVKAMSLAYFDKTLRKSKVLHMKSHAASRSLSQVCIEGRRGFYQAGGDIGINLKWTSLV